MSQGKSEGKFPLDMPLRSDLFLKWAKDSVFEIEHAQLLMAQPLSDDPAILVQQMTEIEAQYERVNALFADSKNFYYLAKRESLVQRQDDYTDLDREAIQKAAVCHQRRVMDTLEGMVEAIKSRMMLGMNLRKAHVAERTTDRMQEAEI